MHTIASNNDSAPVVLDRAPAAPHTAVMGPAVDFAPVVAELRAALGRRSIQHGYRILESLRPALDTLEPRAGAGVLTGLVAQWVDAGYGDPTLVRRLLERFPKETRSALPVLDYLHLRMAEGLWPMANEDFERASACFEAVLAFEEEVDDPEMFAIANFWAGRCCRKRGRYGQALDYTTHAETLALSQGYGGMAAIIQVTLSWLAFQKGRLHEATAVLARAEEALDRTDDFVNRGNVQSAYGRIARRQGKYDIAVGRFERALSEFRQGAGAPPHVARTLVNMAFVKRLIAARIEKETDHGGAARRERRARIEEIRGQAADCLVEASCIYEHQQHHRGIAAARITHGYLALDAGDLERAAADAAEAFEQGSGKADLIVIARARTLQCIVENAKIEEELGDAAQHREAAEAFARDAVAAAGRTENRRVLARALVWQGLTFTVEPADPDAARRCCEQAVALLQPDAAERQYVWEDLEALKNRVLHARPVDHLLRAWCDGLIEGQSFQQIAEEFARIVIPRVWEREGRKVSKVAEKLSISPKKVRRILQSAGVRGRLEA